MIKVDTNSWHCRLLDFKDMYFNNPIGWHRPKTLCTYFWSVVFAPFKMSLVWSLLTIVWLFGFDEDEDRIKHKPAFWTMSITTATMLYLIIPMMFGFGISEPYEIFIIIVTVIILAICLGIIILRLKDKHDSRTRSFEPKGESFFSLTKQTIKAAKKKVCPLIEYND